MFEWENARRTKMKFELIIIIICILGAIIGILIGIEIILLYLFFSNGSTALSWALASYLSF
jgi:predicted membrane-bound spermidine synthase